MEVAFYPADIMLPKKEIDMTKWSVVACDQYTSEPEYWEQVEKQVGQNPSTLRMMLPEIYLESEEEKKRLEQIRKAMDEYLKEQIFVEYKHTMVYVERTDSRGNVRKGIMGCIDLEQYDYQRGSTSLVRATEETVVERIPARIRVRENAPMELPHIMILIDDIKDMVITAASDNLKECELAYDFELMMDGGHLKGYLLKEKEQEKILSAVEQLSKELSKQQKEIFDYGPETDTTSPFLLFAVGDGNHSLASAKAYYETLKKEHPEEDLSNHPARYALAEIVNLHSPALKFEPIHRIVTEVDVNHILEKMKEQLGLVTEGKGQKFCVVQKGEKTEYIITKPSSKLTVGSLQNFLDSYQKETDIKMDYVHEEEVVEALAMEENSIGFVLPVMEKEELFPTVICDGALPRKTFSMGHAQDKRYYTECRKIR